jgi:hypothetical protein
VLVGSLGLWRSKQFRPARLRADLPLLAGEPLDGHGGADRARDLQIGVAAGAAIRGHPGLVDRRSRSELVKTLVLGLGYGFFMFWVAVIREMSIEDKTFAQAVVTGAWAFGVIVIVSWIVTALVWTNKP